MWWSVVLSVSPPTSICRPGSCVCGGGGGGGTHLKCCCSYNRSDNLLTALHIAGHIAVEPPFKGHLPNKGQDSELSKLYLRIKDKIWSLKTSLSYSANTFPTSEVVAPSTLQ